MNKKWFYIQWHIRLDRVPVIKAEVLFVNEEEIVTLIASKTGNSQGHVRKVILDELTTDGEKNNRADLVERVFENMED
ncbi:MAG TPA: hypothetical protein PK950_02555 [Candidatus Paceibacterota bacterium]|nr:hypothetical protein [Candidatus Paceibacterota bacterium]